MSLFDSLVRPTILYGSIMWEPSLHESGWASIEGVQTLLQRITNVIGPLHTILYWPSLGLIFQSWDYVWFGLASPSASGLRRLSWESSQVFLPSLLLFQVVVGSDPTGKASHSLAQTLLFLVRLVCNGPSSLPLSILFGCPHSPPSLPVGVEWARQAWHLQATYYHDIE